MLNTSHFTPEFKSECAVRLAADEYRLSLQAFRAGKITADQHRAENRRIRSTVSEMEWEKAKFRAIHTL